MPLYLPNTLSMEDSNHKLLLSFSIGYKINAKDIVEQSNWYGTNVVYDFV